MGHPCPNCGLEREFSAALAGLRVCCRGCSHFFDLPKSGKVAAPAAAPAAPRFSVPSVTDPPAARPAAPPARESAEVIIPAEPVAEPASRIVRLGARLIDTALLLGAAFGGVVVGAWLYPVTDDDELTGAVLRDIESSATSSGLLAAIVMLGLNVVLLSIRGQSVGKWILGIQIVRDADGDRVGFLRGFLLRDGVTLLIKLVPIGGTIYVWVDSLFIFNAERRCLHDFIAGTRVERVLPVGHSDYPTG
jgi:uncharacterized RDD family membrane protein YckC